MIHFPQIKVKAKALKYYICRPNERHKQWLSVGTEWALCFNTDVTIRVICILVYQTKGKMKIQIYVSTQTWISETWPSILKCRFSHKTLFSEDYNGKKARYPVTTWYILPHLHIHHHVREFLSNLGSLFCHTWTYTIMPNIPLAIFLPSFASPGHTSPCQRVP